MGLEQATMKRIDRGKLELIMIIYVTPLEARIEVKPLIYMRNFVAQIVTSVDKKYAQVDQDATEVTLKFLIELIVRQAVDRDDDGIVVSSDLRLVFHLSINDSNRVIRELRGRGNSGRGTISGITIEDFVWAFRHTSNFSDGSKIKVILNDMAVIKRLSAVDDANPTSGRHLRIK